MAFIKYVPPAEIAESDRVADDDNILRIHGVAYFAFVNRIASGLRVELEPRHD